MQGYVIKQRTAVWILSMIVVLINCRWGEFVPFIPSVGGIYDIILIILLFFWCRFSYGIVRRISGIFRFLDRFVLVMMLLWVVEIVVTVLTDRNTFFLAFSDFLQWHMKILFAYPLCYLMNEYGVKKIIKHIVIIQIIFILIQTLVALVYNINGSVLIDGMIRSETWVRNGYIRMSSSPFTCFITVWFFIRFLSEKKVRNKIKYIVAITLLFVFMYLVNGGRAQYFAVAVAIVMTYMINRRSTVKQFAAVAICFLGMYIFFSSSVYDNIVATLIDDYTRGNGTIQRRMDLLNWFDNTYGFTTILGLGYVGSSIQVGYWTFAFIDYGLFGDYFQFGIVSLIYFVVLVLRGFLVGRGLRIQENKLISYGMSIYLIASAVGFTPLSGKRVLLIPFLLACYETMRYNERNTMQSHGGHSLP